MEKTIIADHVTKEYRIYHRTVDKYLDFFFDIGRGDRFQALRDINFNVEKGESIGFVGLNGSGKSTLANIIAGSAMPTSGTMTVIGAASMTSVSGGLVKNLTGMENIVQKGLLLGLTHRQIQEMMPGIIEFADVGPFIDQQVKTYSSGMKSKLAFAINVNIDTDIMVIDEALSVGDPTFSNKCLVKMQEFRSKGKTIIFVSHSMTQIRDFCDRVIWLEGGQMKMDSRAAEVINEYSDFIKFFNEQTPEDKKKFMAKLRASQILREHGKAQS